MLRRVLVNTGLAFILFPSIMLLTGYFNRYLMGDYSAFTGSFWGFTRVTLLDVLRAPSWWMLLGVLLPYNTGVYYYRQFTGKKIRLVYKILFFVLIEFLSFVVMGAGGYFFISLVSTLKLLLVLSILSSVIVMVHDYFLRDG